MQFLPIAPAAQDLLWRDHGLDVQILQLLGRDGSRALRHQILSLLRLRKGNDVANTGGTAQQCHHAIESEGNAAMRRSPVGKGFEHIAEAAFHDVRRDF